MTFTLPRSCVAPCAAAAALSFCLVGAHAAPVDLGTWAAESYPAVAGFGAGVWTPSGDGSSVYQSVNGQPTLFVSDFNSFGTDVRGRIRSVGGGDNDFIGFAIGYQPNDINNASADYLLIDWKQGTQYFDFGAPSGTPGSTAYAGLAVSRVTGIPTADEFWGHAELDGNGQGLEELARGTTLGSTGWTNNQEYEFRFVFQPDSLQVYVDGALEMSIAGAFSDGRLAFYNFSQAGVTYSAFTRDVLPPVPEPSTYALMLGGLVAVGALARRRSRQPGA